MKTISLKDLQRWRQRRSEAQTISELKQVAREFRDEFELGLKGADIFTLLENKPLTLAMLEKIDFRTKEAQP